MYAPKPTLKDRSGAIAAVIAIHLGLAFMLLNLAGKMDLIAEQPALEIFDVSEIKPPAEPPPPIVQKVETEKPKEKEGAAAPRNIRSQATPVVAPKPKIELPAKSPVVATETPGEGASPTQGASDVRGPGTGAGGVGTGTGSGGAGSGLGGGGVGLATVRTRLATRPLRGRDFPREMLDGWPRGAWALMRFRVDAEGNIVQCILDQRTGVASIDSRICDVARQRLRFRPALDRYGRRVADWAAYGQEPPR